MTKTNPKTSSTGMTHVRNALGNIHVNSDVSSKIFLDKWKRLRVQHDYLGDIMKGMAQCRKTVITRGQAGSDGYAHWQIHQSGKQSIHGLKPCSHVDCSTCGTYQRQKLANTVEMACRENFQRKGESYLVTATYRSSTNPDCIDTLIKATKKVSEWIGGYNRDKGTEIAYWGARECTFSANRPTARRPHIPRYFYHPHVHWIFVFSEKDHQHKDDFFKKLKKRWISYVNKFNGTITWRKGANKGQLIYKAMFDVRSTTPDTFVADYIVKNVVPAMEVTFGNIKKGRSTRHSKDSRSLEELKASIALTGDPSEIAVLRHYFTRMKRQKRFIKSDSRLKSLAEDWKGRLKGVHHRSILKDLLSDWCILQNFNYNDWSEHHIHLFTDSLNTLILTEFDQVTSWQPISMDPYLENAEALGILPIKGATKQQIQTERIIARMKLRDLGQSFWRYFQSQSGNYTSTPAYLDSGRKSPDEFALDPIIYHLKIPKPLFDWLSSTNVLWPILDQIRWHVLCISPSPCLKETMELLCSDLPVSSPDFTYKTGSLSADFSLKKVRELVIGLISQAIYLDNPNNPKIQNMKPLLLPPLPKK
mgnify:CR=1 FL=1